MHRVALVDRALAHHRIGLGDHPAKHARGLQARVAIDDLLEVGREVFVARLVHHHVLDAVVEARHAFGELGVEPGQFVELGRRHRVPGNDGTVDHALGERVRNLRQRHADRNGADRAQDLRRLARRAAHLQALEVGRLGDQLVLHVQHVQAVGMEGQHLHFLELVRRIGAHVFPRRLGGAFTVVGEERQLEDLGAREAVGRVARQRPHHVHHALAGLIKQLGRRAAHLHGRVVLELQAPVRFFLDLVHPRHQHARIHIGGGRHKGLEAQGDGGLGLGGDGRCGHHGGGGLEQGSALDHGVSLG